MALFDADKFRKYLEVKDSEIPVFFWHGQETNIRQYTFSPQAYMPTYEPFGGEANADRVAASHGGKTLKMCILENKEMFEKAGVRFVKIIKDNQEFIRIGYGRLLEATPEFWQACSAVFAQNAKDKIYCIKGTDLRPIDTSDNKKHRFSNNFLEETQWDSIYNRIELPIMKLLGKVKDVVHINPVDGSKIHQQNIQEEFEDVYGKQSDAETIRQLSKMRYNIPIKNLVEKLKEHESLKNFGKEK